MKTNLKNHLVEFSQGWESYVNECMRLVDDSLRFYVTKDHRVYEVLIREVVSEIQSLLDERIYKVKGSVGQSSLTGIPWLSVMDKHVTESTQEGFYISYLFSKNAKKLKIYMEKAMLQRPLHKNWSNNYFLKKRFFLICSFFY